MSRQAEEPYVDILNEIQMSAEDDTISHGDLHVNLAPLNGMKPDLVEYVKAAMMIVLATHAYKLQRQTSGSLTTDQINAKLRGITETISNLCASQQIPWAKL
jgi:hypothetical protein